MPIERRCLVPSCRCRSYTPDLLAYTRVADEDEILGGGDERMAEAVKDELEANCVVCGHTELEHELALTE